MEQIVLFNEIKKYLESTESYITLVDQIDDRGRRFHFRHDWYLMVSFREDKFNIKDINDFLDVMYNNYIASPSKSFTDSCMLLQDTLLPYFKMKQRQEKIKNIIDESI